MCIFDTEAHAKNVAALTSVHMEDNSVDVRIVEAHRFVFMAVRNVTVLNVAAQTFVSTVGARLSVGTVGDQTSVNMIECANFVKNVLV